MKVLLKRREGFLKSVGAFLLCECLLAGCAAAQEKTPQDAPVAVGRYVETEITPAPDGLVLDQTLCIAPQPDGTIDYFAASPTVRSNEDVSTFHHLRSRDNGETWEEVPTPWRAEMSQKCGYDEGDPWFVDQKDGTIYCIFPDVKQHMRLFAAAEDGSVSEVGIKLWQSSKDISIDSFRVTQSGQLGVSYFNDRVALYAANGKKLLDDYNVLSGAAAFADNAIYSYNENGLSIKKQDEAPRTMELPQNVYEPLFDVAGGALYIISKGGVYAFNEKTSVFEILMKGPRYQYGNPDCSISAFRYVPETDQFFVVLSGEDGKQRLFRYAFDPTLPLQPQEQLSVFSIWHEEAMERSIMEFQTTFPNVEVEYTNTWSGGSRTEKEAAAALEAELARGKGPDVILLDRMDADRLVDEGWFLPLAPPEGCFENILEAFKREGGYMALPARFDAELPCRAAFGELPWEGILSGKTRHEFDDPALVPDRGQYRPMLIAAVNANGKNVETARTFVSNLFTEAAQEDETNYGFPVRRASFLDQAKSRVFSNAVDDGLRPVKDIWVVLEPGLEEQCEALTRMEVIPSQLEPDVMESPERSG